MSAKWECPPIHPANDLPPMSDAELAELAEDIKAHGMHEPIVLWRDNREEAKGSSGPFPLYLLDGRNRLAALERIGINDPYAAEPGGLVVTTVRTLNAVKRVSYLGRRMKYAWETDCDPYTFHKSMNVFRRHLTPEQRRWQIKQAIVADPKASDREISRREKVSHHTVAATRAEMSVQNGQTAQNEHRPAERVAEVLKSEPKLSTREVAAKAGVSAGPLTGRESRPPLFRASQSRRIRSSLKWTA
jgi:hypothetical protein